jgi:hypothetical protein
MQKYEYLIEAARVSPHNERGQEGWRLVAIDGGIVFYERPIEETAEQAAAAIPPVPFFGNKPVEPLPTDPMPPSVVPVEGAGYELPPPAAAPVEPPPVEPVPHEEPAPV